MLPISASQSYHSLLQLLLTLRDQLKQADPQRFTIQKTFEESQQFFLEQVLGATDGPTTSSARSLQTEIHRLFKLLSTDFLFLTSSRQPATTQHRMKIIGDRLEQLILYCEKLLKEWEK